MGVPLSGGVATGRAVPVAFGHKKSTPVVVKFQLVRECAKWSAHVRNGRHLRSFSVSVRAKNWAASPHRKEKVTRPVTEDPTRRQREKVASDRTHLAEMWEEAAP
jgi:hypothetical protein